MKADDAALDIVDVPPSVEHNIRENLKNTKIKQLE
jgi:hypothetical protein